MTIEHTLVDALARGVSEPPRAEAAAENAWPEAPAPAPAPAARPSRHLLGNPFFKGLVDALGRGHGVLAGVHQTSTACDELVVNLDSPSVKEGLAGIEALLVSPDFDPTMGCAFVSSKRTSATTFQIRTWTAGCEPATAFGRTVYWAVMGPVLTGGRYR